MSAASPPDPPVRRPSRQSLGARASRRGASPLVAAFLAAVPSFAAVLAAPAPASAQVGVQVHEVAAGGVRVDGSLRDWRRIRFVSVGSGEDGSFRFALGYDEAGLYVAANVQDDRLVRTRRPGPLEDAIVVTVALPEGRGLRGHDLWLWAGIPGAQAGSVGIAPVGGRPRPLAGARIVEGPRRGGGGYVVEAYLPLRAIPGGDRLAQGRVALRMVDVDREARPVVEGSPASAAVDARRLEGLPSMELSGGESGLLRSFLAGRDLQGTRPRYDLRGDVAGDARSERVVVVEHYVVVMGAGYRSGESFDFFELPVAAAADVRSAELVDLTGDGKAELVLRLRQTDTRGARELWQLLSFEGERVRPLFGVELRKETAGGFVEALLEVRRAPRGPPLVSVSVGPANGLDAQRLRETPATGVEPILLPWGPVASRTYQWDGQRFAVIDERPNADPRPAPATRAGTPRDGAAPTSERPAAPTTAQLAAEFRQRAGLAEGARPRFRIVANVAEDRRDEEVLVYGRHLVVVGPAFRGGTEFFHFSVPAASDEDVLSVTAEDLTGDGRRELLLRVRQRLGEVLREVLLVHGFTPAGFLRLLAVEVAREQGGSRLANEVRVVGRGRGPRFLEVGPGRARGWDEASWPFADGTGDEVDPILLPWRDRAARYRHAGGRLVR